MNRDLGIHPQPRISMKIAYFLSDTTQLGRANLYVIPGSHLSEGPVYANEGDTLPEGGIAVQAKAGSALLFDRRLWHAASPSVGDVARRAMFYGYSHRWLRPKSAMDVGHILPHCDAIQRQLLGESSRPGGYFAPGEEDVPLREWISENLGEDAVAP